MPGNLQEGVAGVCQLGEGLGLGLVGKYDVDVLVHDVVQERFVGLHDIVGGHVERYDAAGFAGHLYRPADKCLVLNEVSFDMEIVIALEILGLEILGDEVERGAEIDGEGPLGIAAAHEHHGAS